MRKHVSVITTLTIHYAPLGTTIIIRDARGRNDKRIAILCQSGLKQNTSQNTFTATTESEWNTALDMLKIHTDISAT